MKKDERKVKNDTDANPPRGMGNGLERSYSKLFLLLVVTISEKLYDSSWSLYRMKSRSYKVPKLKITVEKGRPLGGFGWPKSHFQTAAYPLSIIPDKNK